MIHISEEVRKLLGPERVASLIRLGTESICPIDAMPVSTTAGDDMAVIVESYIDEDVIRFAHLGCLESQIVFIGGQSPSGVTDDVTYAAIVLPSLAPRAILILTSDNPERVFTDTGETFSPWTSGLLDLGWEMVRSIGREPISESDWTLTIDSRRDSGEILDSGNNVMLDRLAWSSSVWREIAIASGHITVYSGAFALDRVMKSSNPLIALQRLAKEGEVVAALAAVKLKNTGAPLSWAQSIQEAGMQVADLLHRSAGQTAKGMSAVNPRAFGVALNRVPSLFAVRFSDFPILLMDLNETDELGGREVLQELIKSGVPSGPAVGADHLLSNAPKGWSGQVWPGQIRILTKRGNAIPTTALFERFSGSTAGWYKDAARRMAVGLVIGSGVLDGDLEGEFESNIRSGTWIGFGLPILPAISADRFPD